MSKKNKITAATVAVVMTILIVLVFIFSSTVKPNDGPINPQTNLDASAASTSVSENEDEPEFVYAFNSSPFEFNAEQVAHARTALIEAGYEPVHIAHPYEGCELFMRVNTPALMEVPIAEGNAATDGPEGPGDDAGAVGGDNHSEKGLEPYNQFALLCGNGVRMVSGDLVFDVNVLSNIRRTDNGERLYPMISEEQAETAADMWSAAEKIRETGSHPDQENAIILNGRMVPNAGFIVMDDVLYLPIEKLAKSYFAFAEVNEGRRTIICINGTAYTFYGDKLSDAQRESFGIKDGEYAISNPIGVGESEAMLPVYTTGGYIVLDALGRALGWEFEFHGDYLEIVTDPLDVNQNFVVLPEHDMIILDQWFLNNGHTLYGWDEYMPKFYR